MIVIEYKGRDKWVSSSEKSVDEFNKFILFLKISGFLNKTGPAFNSTIHKRFCWPLGGNIPVAGIKQEIEMFNSLRLDYETTIQS